MPAQTICEGVDSVGVESVWATGKLKEMMLEDAAGAEGDLGRMTKGLICGRGGQPATAPVNQQIFLCSLGDLVRLTRWFSGPRSNFLF